MRIGIVTALVLAFAPPASPPPAPPPPPSPPPAVSTSSAGQLTMASKLHLAGDYVGAAVAFHAIVNGPSVAEIPAAQLGLVRALYRLDLYSAAKAFALPLAERTHPMRRAALPWLVALARELDPDPQLLDVLASYDAADLEDAQLDEVRGDLQYMIGRARYRQAELPDAIVALASVPTDAEDYVPAQYLAGVAHTRLGDAQGAASAFKNVLRVHATETDARTPRQTARLDRYAFRRTRLESLDRTRALRRLKRRMLRRGVTSADLDRFEEHRRLDEMSSLAMAYVFYQAGQLDLASKYFRRVPQSSPYWLDAIFGDAWAEFLMAYTDDDHANEHYQRVLGHVHTLRAPFFPYRLYPELPLLAAVTYYYNCRYGSAARALDEFDTQYLATRDRLQEFLAKQPEDFELAELFGRIRAGETTDLDEDTLHIISGLLDDRALRRQHDRIAKIDAEREAAGVLDGAEASALAEVVHEEIDLAASRAREESGAGVRTRLETAVSEIRRFERQALGIRYELAPKLAELGKGTEGAAVRPHSGIETDLYEYNGEYWQDELGHYRVEITSLCEE